MPLTMRALATDASNWPRAHLLLASVAASSEDHPGVPARNLGSESRPIHPVQFLFRATGAIDPAPFHREIVAQQNEGSHAEPETLGYASVIDQHRILSASLRLSQ